nr:lysozyme family protein [Bacillus halotolerans]
MCLYLNNLLFTACNSGYNHFTKAGGGGDGEYETVGIAPGKWKEFRAVYEKYARQKGVFDQVNIIMALTMQESGGRSLDIMQSSESIGLPPNSITDPENSIEVADYLHEQGNLMLSNEYYRMSIEARRKIKKGEIINENQPDSIGRSDFK